jgi:hypothetical protein
MTASRDGKAHSPRSGTRLADAHRCRAGRRSRGPGIRHRGGPRPGRPPASGAGHRPADGRHRSGGHRHRTTAPRLSYRLSHCLGDDRSRGLHHGRRSHVGDRAPSAGHRRGSRYRNGLPRHRRAVEPGGHRTTDEPGGHRKTDEPGGHRRTDGPTGHRRTDGLPRHRRTDDPDGHRTTDELGGRHLPGGRNLPGRSPRQSPCADHYGSWGGLPRGTRRRNGWLRRRRAAG